MFPGFEKGGDFVLNNGPSKTLWKFTNISVDPMLKGSHIYLLVVDSKVKKIGCSVTQVKKCANYECGNGGSPSDRTTGIHYYIANELKQGRIVEFYYKMAPCVEAIEMRDIFDNLTSIKNVYIDPKTMENHYLESFKSRFGRLPEWNMQEQGRKSDWPREIKNIRNALKDKKIIEYVEEHTNSEFLMLYHWKYNNVNTD